MLRNSEEGCVLFDGNPCIIYEARPKTCRDFPHIAVGTHSLGGRLFDALEDNKHLTGYL
jgi:Fe-S-cluster containining protein